MATGTYERELLNVLTDCGYMSFRAPASGAGRDCELPDVIVGQSVQTESGTVLSEVWGIEAKSTSSNIAYVEEEEVEELDRFCERFGATSFLSARFKSRGPGSNKVHYLCHPESCRITPQGNYALPLEDIEDRAVIKVDATEEEVIVT